MYAFFESHNERLDQTPPQGLRYEFGKAYQLLRVSFEKTHGIKEIYWGPIETGCASVLTADDNIFDVAPAPEESTLDLYQVVWDCEKLIIEVRRNLSGTPRAVAMKRLFEIITNAMAALPAPNGQVGGTQQAQPKPPSPPPSAGMKSVPPTPSGGPPKPGAVPEAVVKFLQNQVQEVQNYYQKMATRVGLTFYLTGTAAGVVLTGLVVVLILVSHSIVASSSTSVDALAAFIAGAAGGAVGVMTRLLNADLTVDYDAGRTQILLGGFFRPIVGGVLGSAFFAAVFSGLIPLTVPADSTKALAFYSFVAFIGGLAERWAQDTLVQTGEGIFGTSAKAKSAKKGTATNNVASASPAS